MCTTFSGYFDESFLTLNNGNIVHLLFVINSLRYRWDIPIILFTHIWNRFVPVRPDLHFKQTIQKSWRNAVSSPYLLTFCPGQCQLVNHIINKGRLFGERSLPDCMCTQGQNMSLSHLKVTEHCRSWRIGSDATFALLLMWLDQVACSSITQVVHHCHSSEICHAPCDFASTLSRYGLNPAWSTCLLV